MELRLQDCLGRQLQYAATLICSVIAAMHIQCSLYNGAVYLNLQFSFLIFCIAELFSILFSLGECEVKDWMHAQKCHTNASTCIQLLLPLFLTNSDESSVTSLQAHRKNLGMHTYVEERFICLRRVSHTKGACHCISLIYSQK